MLPMPVHSILLVELRWNLLQWDVEPPLTDRDRWDYPEAFSDYAEVEGS
jgi:hypothetical protein